MVLFLSDLHLGRGAAAESRAAEADARALLRAHEADLQALYLVGDVFDQYLEYKHLIPKGFTRLMGHLAALVDGGVAVTYLVGNRDPWHLGYFADELGVRLRFEPLEESKFGEHLYIAHGDGLIPHDRLYNRLRPLLRHPAVVRLYRMGLPGDAGYALARWTGRLLADVRDTRSKPETVAALRTHARERLSTTPATLAVFGHCHAAELTRWPEGAYLNPGYWFADRTFGRLDADGLHLLTWPTSA